MKKKLTRKDIWIIGVTSLVSGLLLLLLLLLPLSTIGFGGRSESISTFARAIRNPVIYLVYLTPLVMILFLIFKTLYKKSRTIFWVLSLVLNFLVILGIFSFNHLLIPALLNQ